MNVLALESSCDETAASVVSFRNGKILVKSNIVASQVEVHSLYGGVVPEIASRAHSEVISKITYQALGDAEMEMKDIDAIAVTSEPGLIGALLVGVNFAKALAFANHKPLIPINHMRGHVAACYTLEDPPKPPFLALIVSGGHTLLVHVSDYTEYHVIGRTRDDAAGEAFDKVARVIGLTYPGGAEMDRLASAGNKNAIHFPSAAVGECDFSFSGLKTAALNYINSQNQKALAFSHEDLAASFTHTVVNSIVKQTLKAADLCGCKTIVASGGVMANSHLRKALTQLEQTGYSVYLSPKSLCGDNAVMIGAQACYEYEKGNFATIHLNAKADAEC